MTKAEAAGRRRVRGLRGLRRCPRTSGGGWGGGRQVDGQGGAWRSGPVDARCDAVMAGDLLRRHSSTARSMARPTAGRAAGPGSAGRGREVRSSGLAVAFLRDRDHTQAQDVAPGPGAGEGLGRAELPTRPGVALPDPSLPSRPRPWHLVLTAQAPCLPLPTPSSGHRHVAARPAHRFQPPLGLSAASSRCTNASWGLGPGHPQLLPLGPLQSSVLPVHGGL